MEEMAEQPNGSRSWWLTLPGILTAAGALITAITGLLLVLHQAGLLGRQGGPATSTTSTPSASASSTTTSTHPPSAPANAFTANDIELLNLLPTGYSQNTCTPLPPPLSALSYLHCKPPDSINGSPTDSWYFLFDNQKALQDGFEQVYSQDTPMRCTGWSESDPIEPHPWQLPGNPDKDAGSIACGVYQSHYDVIWTKSDSLILGDAQGPNLTDLHNWFRWKV
jgi:serine/threonine-protein kinase